MLKWLMQPAMRAFLDHSVASFIHQTVVDISVVSRALLQPVAPAYRVCNPWLSPCGFMELQQAW